MTLEKRVRISGNPSLYHRGLERYMGGDTIYPLDGLASQTASRASRISWRAGSTRWVTEEGPSQSVRKFVTQDTMQTFNSDRTDSKEEPKISRFPQLITWHALTRGLARVVFFVRFLRTLESPRIEKQKAWDILKVEQHSAARNRHRHRISSWSKLNMMYSCVSFLLTLALVPPSSSSRTLLLTFAEVLEHASREWCAYFNQTNLVVAHALVYDIMRLERDAVTLTRRTL